MSDRPADRPQPHQILVHPQHRHEGGNVNHQPQSGYEGGNFNHQPQSRYFDGGRYYEPGKYSEGSRYYEGGAKSYDQRGPSSSQVLALLVGLPVGGTLLALSGLTLMETLIGLAVAMPLFALFSPVIVPAAIAIAIAIGLAVAGVLTSGACWLMAMTSFSWILNYVRETQGTVPEQLDWAKNRVADMAGYVGKKTKEVGQDIQIKAQDAKAYEIKAQDTKTHETKAHETRRT